MDISNFDDETFNAIRRMSERGAQWISDGCYDSMQSQCAQLLYKTSESRFPGRARVCSLYSLRHQFIANMKSVMKPEEVSALAGHAVTDTAISNYGKKRSSWSPEDINNVPNPLPDEVVSVRQQLRFFEDRKRIMQAAGLEPPTDPHDLES